MKLLLVEKSQHVKGNSPFFSTTKKLRTEVIVNRLTTLEDSVCHSMDRYELVDGSQIIQTEIETFNVRLYDDLSFLINMLKTVGFREIRMMNPFDKKSVPNIDATAIVYECMK